MARSRGGLAVVEREPVAIGEAAEDTLESIKIVGGDDVGVDPLPDPDDPEPKPQADPDALAAVAQAEDRRTDPTTGTPRVCVTGHIPDLHVDIPNIPEDVMFTKGKRISETIDALIGHFQEFSGLKDWTFSAYWVNKEIRKQGVEQFGATTKPGGFQRHLLGGADFLISMSIPACQGLANYEFEAAIYHQLKYCQEIEATNIQGETTYRPGIRGPEFSGYVSEIERYGLWSIGLREPAKAYAEQLTLSLAD